MKHNNKILFLREGKKKAFQPENNVCLKPCFKIKQLQVMLLQTGTERWKAIRRPTR